jgi:hypothetical protein
MRNSVRTLVCLVCLTASAALAQTSVTVDLAKPINVLGDTAVGFPAAMFNADNFKPEGLGLLRTAGVTTPRYPAPHGVADLYHWSVQKASHYKGADAPYIAPESNFGTFAQIAEKLGNALIVVNYGSNMDGNAGGDPVEAAAWVAYANGDPSNSRTLGKDSTGADWQTVGYWATLRASAPQAADDGYNFLRINHPKPFGFKLWQVGDQVYNNGFLGGTYTGNPDLHGPAPDNAKDLAKLRKDPKLSPAAFAENLKLFSAAMKAVDPSIQIGTAMIAPQQDKPSPDWNRPVLKAACPAIDFVSIDYSTAPLLAPDYKTLDEANLFQYTKNDISRMVNGMLDDDKGLCPKDHTPRIALSSAIIPTWPKFDHPVVNALWVADTYALLEESGFLNIDWAEAYGDTMIGAGGKKFGPAFYGLQMLHIVAFKAGDALLDTKSSSSTVSVHASRRRDGIVGILLVNTSTSAPATVKISLKNGNVGTTGKRFDYGQAQFTQGAGPAASPLTVAGGDFTVTLPAYSITDLLLPLAK